MTMTRRCRCVLAYCAALLASPGVHAVFELSNVGLSDLSPGGFSVIGQASEPATPGLRIYADAGGTQEITDQFEVRAFPMGSGDPQAGGDYARDQSIQTLANRAQALGTLKIQAHGGQPGGTYWFHLQVQGATETRLWPQGAPALLTLPGESGFHSDSKQLLVSVDQAGADRRGTLVVARVSGTLAPVSAYVGDGAEPHQAFLNLNNLFTVGLKEAGHKVH